jgi:DNA-binding NarL/FixJ family response regulator
MSPVVSLAHPSDPANLRNTPNHTLTSPLIRLPIVKHKIYILDDHPIVIEGLRKVIEGQNEMTVLGSSEDANEALTQITKMRPDVVILDITLKDRSGVDLIKKIRTTLTTTQVLVYSMHDENVYAERCLRAGAMGYLMKSEGGSRVIQGLEQILGGSFCFSANLIGSIVSGGGPRTGSRGEPGRLLSDRQLEIFEMVGRGFDSHEISQKLALSAKTVDAHKANIRQKLGLNSARELLMEAVRWVEK